MSPNDYVFSQFASSFGYSCEGAGNAFMPYLLSTLDTVAWRYNIPEMAYPEALIPGEREIGKADTLNDVVATVEETIAQQRPGEAQFMLAASSAGIEAATNIVVEQATREMLFWVYGAVTLMCLITFRSWRAAVVAILPLILTSILAEALMAKLGIGMKVATLPVIALEPRQRATFDRGTTAPQGLASPAPRAGSKRTDSRGVAA